jgi:hypothetical protein
MNDGSKMEPDGKDADTARVGSSGIPYDGRRQADLYWRQIEQLNGAAVCIRLYRNRLARRVKAVEITKACASSGAMAG